MTNQTGDTAPVEPERQAEFLARLLDALEPAIAATGLDGRVLHWNHHAARLFGVSPEEASGRSLADLVAALPSGPDHRAIDDHVRRGGSWAGEVVVRRGDGREFPAAVTAAPLRGEGGDIMGVVRTWTDLTEPRRGEARRRQAQVMHALGRLAGGVAHDFNNILTAIRGYAGFLMQDLPEGPQRDDAGEIHAATDRAMSLTRQLFAIADTGVVERETLDLNAVLAEMKPALAARLGPAVEVAVEPGPDLPAVSIGRSRLEEAVTLLALNAREAMPGGGTVAMTTRRADQAPVAAAEPAENYGYVELVVSDTGPGIPPDVLPHIFEPFFTTKGPGHPGLGLTTVYGIATRAGGDARTEPARGGGATFILRLPGGPPPG